MSFLVCKLDGSLRGFELILGGLLGVLSPTPLKSTVRALAVPLVGGGSGFPAPVLFTSTQSGSGEGVNGLLGRLGLGKWSLLGACTLDRAGRPLSSHHFLRSELAGGRPGSTLSYPNRSSSSVSSIAAPAEARVSPTTSFLLPYRSRANCSFLFSSILLIKHWKVAYTGRWSEKRSGAQS